MNLKEFGVYFARVREKSGYRSQRELADVSGVSHSTINRIEAGTHKAKHETLKALAPYLKGVTYEELLEKAGVLEDNPSSSEQKGKTGVRKDTITNVFFREWDKASEEKKKRTLEFLRFLNQQDDEESNKK
jgi:HTH-type transcriptional regulator, competence development regulator